MHSTEPRRGGPRSWLPRLRRLVYAIVTGRRPPGRDKAQRSLRWTAAVAATVLVYLVLLDVTTVGRRGDGAGASAAEDRASEYLAFMAGAWGDVRHAEALVPDWFPAVSLSVVIVPVLLWLCLRAARTRLLSASRRLAAFGAARRTLVHRLVLLLALSVIAVAGAVTDARLPAVVMSVVVAAAVWHTVGHLRARRRHGGSPANRPARQPALVWQEG